MSHTGDRPPAARRRLRWLVPALLLIVWLVVGAVGGPFAGKLADVQKNDNASYLPKSAEATQVLDLQKKFTTQQANPAIVVYQRNSGISAADIAEASADAKAFAGMANLVGPVTGPIRSKDGKALETVVPLSGVLDATLGDVVAGMRKQVTGPSSGLGVYVAGPAGLAADFGTAFGGIDGILLGVAVLVVLVILVAVYRSPVLPFVVLLSALFALSAASALIYALAKNDVITLNGQSPGILFILVVGAATDYALLLVSRFREELREEESRFAAIRVAYRQSFEPILASGTTVILGVLCLLFSDLNANRGLGPVAAIGIACALLTALTFLPAVLALLGRAAFWPVRPRFGSEHSESKGLWAKVSALVGRRPRMVWIGTTLLLVVCAAFLPTLKASGVPQLKLFLTTVQSVTGQNVAAEHFPAGQADPTVIIGPADKLSTIVSTTRSIGGIASVAPVGADGQPSNSPKVADGLVQVQATLSSPTDSAAGEQSVRNLRTALAREVPGTLVGGNTAIQIDSNDTAERDRRVVIPIVLLVILLVLGLLLRSLVAPVLLVLSVVLSFAATLGVSALVFNHLFHFPGADPSAPLYAFVFLVALGIDYNIFLMTRVREEAQRVGPQLGVLRGLAVTGGVITSAGVVLAATFAALAVIPILFLVQIAFMVAFGVLLDTIVVRSLLVPALAYDLGARIWWPGKLSRVTGRHGSPATAEDHASHGEHRAPGAAQGTP